MRHPIHLIAQSKDMVACYEAEIQACNNRYQKYKHANKAISINDTVETHGFFQTIKIVFKISAIKHKTLYTPIYLTV